MARTETAVRGLVSISGSWDNRSESRLPRTRPVASPQPPWSVVGTGAGKTELDPAGFAAAEEATAAPDRAEVPRDRQRARWTPSPNSSPHSAPASPTTPPSSPSQSPGALTVDRPNTAARAAGTVRGWPISQASLRLATDDTASPGPSLIAWPPSDRPHRERGTAARRRLEGRHPCSSTPLRQPSSPDTARRGSAIRGGEDRRRRGHSRSSHTAGATMTIENQQSRESRINTGLDPWLVAQRPGRGQPLCAARVGCSRELTPSSVDGRPRSSGRTRPRRVTMNNGGRRRGPSRITGATTAPDQSDVGPASQVPSDHRPPHSGRSGPCASENGKRGASLLKTR